MVKTKIRIGKWEGEISKSERAPRSLSHAAMPCAMATPYRQLHSGQKSASASASVRASVRPSIDASWALSLAQHFKVNNE